MRRLLATLLFLLCSSPLYAQTHYCDQAQPTTGTAIVGASVTVRHCNDGKDSTGTVPVTPTAFRVYVDGTGAAITMTKGTTSATSGKSDYTGTITAPAAGVHTIQTTAVAGTAEGAKSNTFTLTTTAAVPSAPTNLTAQ